ncbi:glutathione S-transferase family protein [Roseobacter sp. YSTF-M11]|uniref:Glutathione S-transferase family protein n=1 Tax=Roseobacter insulae TaxID=2859783 RepID=A0A9X1FYU6_9RHOB|nr:glutathione S-transferase family protein [Roseobacter insulae]MBW4710244.1 glutathione S-transferase family protein [Roseobacter insulae]
MTSAPYTLHYAPDNASLVVRLALEEIGAPYRTLLVDRSARAQRAPGYLALSPNGLIPVLETPQGPIFETAAILLWLADRHGCLAPHPDAPDRAALLKWLFFLSNTLHPALRILFYPSVYIGAQREDQLQLQSVARHNILGHLGVLDAHWRQVEPPLLLNIYLGPTLRWLKLYPADTDTAWFDLTALPALHGMAKQLETRESVAKAQLAEGLGAHPFTAPRAPSPPEGSAV